MTIISQAFSPRTGRPFSTFVDWSQFDRPTPEWFADSPLGIFIHWGAYSVPAWAEPIGPLGKFDIAYHLKHNPYAEWYYNTIRIDGSAAQQHHRSEHGDAPYDQFLDEWHGESFDPQDWASLFRRAGASYVIPTTKHHDGIALWDAPGTGTRNTVHRGPRRDIIGEISEAVQSEGLRFGVYYSGGLDWWARPHRPHDREGSIDYHDRPMDWEYSRYAVRQCKDLIRRYRPSVLWNDIEWPDGGKLHGNEDSLADLFRFYYDNVPDGVVNDRWGVPHFDYATSEYEQGRDRESGARPWERCRGIGYSFGYNRVETDADMLTGSQIARELVDVVSRGGRLLLNVGPTAAGLIPEGQREALEQLGQWMGKHGKSLHGAAIADQLPVDSDGMWVRWVRADQQLVAFIDLVDERDGRRQLTGQVQLDVPEGWAPEFGDDPRNRASRITVDLPSTRPGPAQVTFNRTGGIG